MSSVSAKDKMREEENDASVGFFLVNSGLGICKQQDHVWKELALRESVQVNLNDLVHELAYWSHYIYFGGGIWVGKEADADIAQLIKW